MEPAQRAWIMSKVRCCAVEMAEAEQTLSFYQKTMQAADNVAACKRVNLSDMEKALTRLAEEIEVQLVLKTGQIEVPLRGCPADYADAVLVTREELLRVNDCIVETGKRKLAAMRRSIHLRKVVSQHEWQHTCAKMMQDDLQQELKDVQQFKVHSKDQKFPAQRCDAADKMKQLFLLCDIISSALL